MRQLAQGDELLALREERDTLREHLRQIVKAHGQNDRLSYSVSLRITRQEASVLCLLVRRGIVSIEQFRALIDSREGFDSNILTTLVCRLRRKIEPLGARIGTSWGSGYFMDGQSRQIIRDFVESWNTGIGVPHPDIENSIARARASSVHHD